MTGEEVLNSQEREGTVDAVSIALERKKALERRGRCSLELQGGSRKWGNSQMMFFCEVGGRVIVEPKGGSDASEVRKKKNSSRFERLITGSGMVMWWGGIVCRGILRPHSCVPHLSSAWLQLPCAGSRREFLPRPARDFQKRQKGQSG